MAITPPLGPERDALKAAFAAAGIELRDAEERPHGKVEIIVGSKPPPF
jgi:hypothetical protein